MKRDGYESIQDAQLALFRRKLAANGIRGEALIKLTSELYEQLKIEVRDENTGWDKGNSLLNEALRQQGIEVKTKQQTSLSNGTRPKRITRDGD